MPLPLAMMIPFMGIQSAVMAKQFGENFQYGKRRISAMSNEEFNKLTPKILNERANEELKSMIPSMQQSLIDMRKFQEFIVVEFMQMINDLIKAGIGKFFGVDEGTLTDIEHFIHGHFDLHKGETVQPQPIPEPFVGPPEPPFKLPPTGPTPSPVTPSPVTPPKPVVKMYHIRFHYSNTPEGRTYLFDKNLTLKGHQRIMSNARKAPTLKRFVIKYGIMFKNKFGISL